MLYFPGIKHPFYVWQCFVMFCFVLLCFGTTSVTNCLVICKCYCHFHCLGFYCFLPITVISMIFQSLSQWWIQAQLSMHVHGSSLGFACLYVAVRWRYAKALMRRRQVLIMDGYRQTSNIIRTLVSNEILDHPDVVGAAPTAISSFST